MGTASNGVNGDVPLRVGRMVEDACVEENRPPLIYEPLVYIDRQTTERELASSDDQVAALALLAASLEEPDAAWVFDRCLAMLDDSRTVVRRAVALAIGHLAIPGDFVDEERAREALGRLAADPIVRPAASDALDDVERALANRGTKAGRPASGGP